METAPILSAAYVQLLNYLLIVVLTIHLPYIGLTLGSSFFSVAFRIFFQKNPRKHFLLLSRDLIELVLKWRAAPVILAFLPLMTIILIFLRMSYSPIRIFSLLWIPMYILAIVGFTLLLWYRSGFQPGSGMSYFCLSGGILGVVTLFAAFYYFIQTMDLALFPERWKFVHLPLQIVFSYHILYSYLSWIVLFLGWTGAGVLIFLQRGRLAEGKEDEEYVRFLRQFGFGLALVATLLLPVVQFAEFSTLPESAITSRSFIFPVSQLALYLAISLLLVGAIKEPQRHAARWVFPLFLFLFPLIVMNGQYGRIHVLKEQTMNLIARSDQARQKLESAMQQGVTKGTAVQKLDGKDVFQQHCTPCHRFDQRLVGPPLLSVLPKYQGKKSDLMSFINNPRMLDPGYPPMPKLGLSLEEIDAVADYLLAVEKEKSSLPSDMEKQPAK